MFGRTSSPWVVALSLLAVSCSDGRYDVTLSFGAGVNASSVLHVDLFLLDHCPDAAATSMGADPEGRVIEQLSLESAVSELPSFGSVPSGSYGLYARGFDTNCQPIAAACTTVRLRGGGSGELALELAQASGAAACDAAVCAEGRCTGAVGDGGTDAGLDAGVDGGEPSTCTLVASADGFTSTYFPTPSSGTGTTIDVFDGDGSARMWSYVAFDPAGSCLEGGTLPSSLTVASATLTLTVLGDCPACSHSLELRRVTSSWTEASVGAGTDPSVAASNLTSFTVPSAGSIDVTALAADVQAWHAAPSSHFGYRIAQSPSSGASAANPFVFGAREHATPNARPRLTVVYTSP